MVVGTTARSPSYRAGPCRVMVLFLGPQLEAEPGYQRLEKQLDLHGRSIACSQTCSFLQAHRA